VPHSMLMPTTKPRYTITDTGKVSEQLDEAQRHWPDVRDRKELLLRLAAAGLDGGDRHHADAQSMLEANSQEPLGASPITLAETLVSPTRAGRLADAQTALQLLGVDELTLGENAPGRLAQLRTDTGLKMPDCCVLLAAQDHDARVATFDTGLLKAAHMLGLATAE
jgi:predicted nucleic acid-binding protein